MMITFFAFPGKKVVRDIRTEKCYHKERGKIECLMKEMDLDEIQEETFFTYRDEHKQKINQLFQSVKSKRKEMIDAIAAETSNTGEKIYFYAEDIGKLEAEIQKETIDYFIKMKVLLNAEQFSKLIDNFRDVCGCNKFKKKHKPYHKRSTIDTCPHENN
jgi:Spy/CpxP family protein refolding chaperone